MPFSGNLLEQATWNVPTYLPVPSQNPVAAYLSRTPALPRCISIILFTHGTSVLRRLNLMGHNNEAFPSNLYLQPCCAEFPFSIP